MVSAQALLPVSQESLVWQTDLMKAHDLSLTGKKPIFAFFTGSDWCGWCHKLQREVFAKPEFITWAKKKCSSTGSGFSKKETIIS